MIGPIEQIETGETALVPLEYGPLVCVVDKDFESLQFLSRVFRAAGLPVCPFASAIGFLENIRHQGPCCLVIDPDLSGLDGFELQRRLSGSAVQFVFMSSRVDIPMCVQAMKAGAMDFLTKPAEPKALVEATARALSQSTAVLTAKSARSAALERIASLTSRELTVMQRVVAGKLNKQIAAELDIAEKTVKAHRGRVMHKTAAVSVPDLVRLAIAAGISGAT